MTHYRVLSLLAAVLAVLVGTNVTRAQTNPAPELALVPADAAGFVHVRFGDALRSEHLKEFRDLIQRAGPKALETLTKRFTPDPLSLDRVTAYLLPPAAGGKPEPEPVVIFRMAKPFDATALTKTLLPGAETTTIGGARFVRDVRKDVALRVIDNQTFQICPVATAERAAAAPRRDGPMAPALALAAAGNKGLIIAVNATALPPQVLAEIPPPLRSLAQVKLATLSIDLAAEPKVEARLRFADADASAAAEQTVRGLVQMGQGALVMVRGELETRLNGNGGPAGLEDLPEALGCVVGLGLISRAEEFLKDLPLRHQGSELSLEIAVPKGIGANLAVGSAMLTGLMVPAVQKVREAAGRTTSMNNLKQVALAMHNHASSYGDVLPSHAVYSKDGKPLLSWRVAILPYIEHDHLYRQFKLDEPWDSENNNKLIPLMPKVYLDPTAPPGPDGMTHYQIIVGGGSPWERGPKKPGMPRTFTDGTSNTIMVVEAADTVIWSKPDDLSYDPGRPLPKFGHSPDRPFLVALADGSIRQIDRSVSEKTLRAAITAAGGEVLGPDWK